MADVTIKYKGANIATMDASGTKTLTTSGKYCEDDVQVVYADPEKPTQSKSATPSLSTQTISPDSGKVLSSVSVAAVTKDLLATLDADFVAENIKKDVDLFGLLGTLEGGGGASGITYGIYIPSVTGKDHTIEHGLGVVPKLFAICAGSRSTDSAGSLLDAAHGFSDRNLLFRTSRIGAADAATGYIEDRFNITQSSFAKNTAIARATAESIDVGGRYNLTAGIEYYWFAVA